MQAAARWLQNACYEPRRDGLAQTAYLRRNFFLEFTFMTIYDLSLLAALALLCN